MTNPFLTTEEQEQIYNAYSMNFKDEFHRIGPYTYETDYGYVISLCPEIKFTGEMTGRILANHYNIRGANRVPEFIDVWVKEGDELCFKYRNRPGHDLISEAERIKVLEEEIEAIKNQKGMDDQSYELYNKAVVKLHARKEEENLYFREAEMYWSLIKERDRALLVKRKEEHLAVADQNKKLVISDMNSLVDECDRDIKSFTAFAKSESSATEITDAANEKLKSLRDTWIEALAIVNDRGFDDEGDYSYATLGYKLSLAYKERSEILNEFRFGLERKNLEDEYEEFDAQRKPEF